MCLPGVHLRQLRAIGGGGRQKMSRKQRVAFRRLDDGMESDPVMLFTNEEMRAVVFPNAESLPQVCHLKPNSAHLHTCTLQLAAGCFRRARLPLCSARREEIGAFAIRE
jgi:hypothetical protein